jgi:hypothetical protein
MGVFIKQYPLPMNEQNLEAAPVEPATMPYKDRSVGLTVFGILTILLGGLVVLMLLFMAFGIAVAARTQNASHPVPTILPVIFIYGPLAVTLVWLGIGSIMARLWARALLLIFSWSWLVMGIFMTAIMPFVMTKAMANLPADPKTGHPPMPPGTITAMIVGMVVFFGLFLVVLPAIWVFFYNSRHVKATCEARDLVPRWTDACPLPVLGFCLWLAFSTLVMLAMPFMNHGVMPFFGMYLTGLPGTLFCLVLAILWGCAARLLYRLDVRGWWLILIALVVFTVSALVTYSHHDIIEMYQLMGYPQAQIDQIQKIGLLTGNRMAWVTLFSMLPFVGYLLFIKKYLPGKP